MPFPKSILDSYTVDDMKEILDAAGAKGLDVWNPFFSVATRFINDIDLDVVPDGITDQEILATRSLAIKWEISLNVTQAHTNRKGWQLIADDWTDPESWVEYEKALYIAHVNQLTADHPQGTVAIPPNGIPWYRYERGWRTINDTATRTSLGNEIQNIFSIEGANFEADHPLGFVLPQVGWEGLFPNYIPDLTGNTINGNGFWKGAGIDQVPNYKGRIIAIPSNSDGIPDPHLVPWKTPGLHHRDSGQTYFSDPSHNVEAYFPMGAPTGLNASLEMEIWANVIFNGTAADIFIESSDMDAITWTTFFTASGTFQSSLYIRVQIHAVNFIGEDFWVRWGSTNPERTFPGNSGAGWRVLVGPAPSGWVAQASDLSRWKPFIPEVPAQQFARCQGKPATLIGPPGGDRKSVFGILDDQGDPITWEIETDGGATSGGQINQGQWNLTILEAPWDGFTDAGRPKNEWMGTAEFLLGLPTFIQGFSPEGWTENYPPASIAEQRAGVAWTDTIAEPEEDRSVEIRYNVRVPHHADAIHIDEDRVQPVYTTPGGTDPQTGLPFPSRDFPLLDGATIIGFRLSYTGTEKNINDVRIAKTTPTGTWAVRVGWKSDAGALVQIATLSGLGFHKVAIPVLRGYVPQFELVGIVEGITKDTIKIETITMRWLVPNGDQGVGSTTGIFPVAMLNGLHRYLTE